MTDTQLTIIIAAIPATMAAMGAVIVSVLNAVRTTRRDNAADDKAEKLAKVTEKIHNDTNSGFTTLTSENKQLVAELASLKDQMIAMYEDKLVANNLAQKLAEKATATAVSETPAAPAEVIVVNTPKQSIPVDPIKPLPHDKK